MRPNTTAITAVARQRHELTRAKAIQALRELHRAAAPITFQAVARTAGVSKSWLYTQPDIRSDIERLRAANRRAPTPAIPAEQRTTNASLHTRLDAALQRNRALTEENARLRRQLAHALGDRRAEHTSPSRSSITIGPC